ncbi:MAG TPA: hypothetical protein VFG86_23840 [Chloroflexota bacterium]|nr:hypothetical protein [Chloroflexota bacterium]
MTPLLFEQHAQTVMQERMRQAEQYRLVAEARRAAPAERSHFVASARVRLAEGLRNLACRLDPCAVASEPRFLIARSR